MQAKRDIKNAAGETADDLCMALFNHPIQSLYVDAWVVTLLLSLLPSPYIIIIIIIVTNFSRLLILLLGISAPRHASLRLPPPPGPRLVPRSRPRGVDSDDAGALPVQRRDARPGHGTQVVSGTVPQGDRDLSAAAAGEGGGGGRRKGSGYRVGVVRAAKCQCLG